MISFLYAILIGALNGLPVEALLTRALRGDEGATDALVQSLTPTIRLHAWRKLACKTSKRGRASREDLDDISQLTWLALFKDRWSWLRRFDASRGPLAGWVRRPTWWAVSDFLKKGRRLANPRSEAPDAGPQQDLDGALTATGPGPEEAALLAHDFGPWEAAFLEGRTSRFCQLYQLLIRRGLPPQRVTRILGMSRGAVDQWKYEIVAQMKSFKPPRSRSLMHLADYLFDADPEGDEGDDQIIQANPTLAPPPAMMVDGGEGRVRT